MSPAAARQRRPAKYRQLSHTADMAWRIRGGTLPELFENAGEALISTLTDRRFLRRQELREISVDAPDLEALLVDWLNRLLYLFDVEGFLGREFKVVDLSPRHLQAMVRGEIFDPHRHPEKTAVKAATYHQLEIVRKNRGWQATVILDL